MTSDRCPAGMPLSALVDYWLDEQGDAALEEHLLACGACCGTLAWIADLAEAVPDIVRRGEATAVLTPGVLQRLRERGLRIREYRVEPGAFVNCTITPSDDLVVSHLAAPLASVTRLDLVALLAGGGSHRFEDIPFDAATGDVVFLPSAAGLRARGHGTDVARLVAVAPDGHETVLGEYTFHHAPFTGADAPAG